MTVARAERYVEAADVLGLVPLAPARLPAGVLPLTPAADYFCDMIRRAAQHMDSMLA